MSTLCPLVQAPPNSRRSARGHAHPPASPRIALWAAEMRRAGGEGRPPSLHPSGWRGLTGQLWSAGPLGYYRVPVPCGQTSSSLGRPCGHCGPGPPGPGTNISLSTDRPGTFLVRLLGSDADLGKSRVKVESWGQPARAQGGWAGPEGLARPCRRHGGTRHLSQSPHTQCRLCHVHPRGPCPL